MNRYFQLNILLRATFIVALSFLLSWSFFSDQLIALSVLLGIILLSAIGNLVFYHNKVNEKISYFFEAIKNEDFSQVYPEVSTDRIVRELNRNLNEVNRQIQQIKIESQQQEQYFQALIEHVGTGILTYNDKGFVIHANSSAKRLLKLGQFTHLKQLKKVDEYLHQTIVNFPQQGQKLITFTGKQGKVNLSIKSNAFKNNDQNLVLLSVQDINQELDEKELDSWLKLIRVLTHEIMNSIAPITSLSESLSGYFQSNGTSVHPSELTEKTIATTIRGLDVIRQQGKGLISFVDSYRKLTRLPKPEKKQVRIVELLDILSTLSRPDLDEKNVVLKVEAVDPDLSIFADDKMISQVLINLIKNAREALEGRTDRLIKLSAKVYKPGKIEICVIDNGPGISSDLLDEIFVPFFTTRENGSGIGLSLSRQIMRLHGGSLVVRSVPEKETTFCLRF